MSQNNKMITGDPVVTEPSKLEPEFVDCVGLKHLFSIGRSSAYELVNLGLIRSVCLRKPGRIRGRRLFHVDSVRQYLLSQESQKSSLVVKHQNTTPAIGQSAEQEHIAELNAELLEIAAEERKRQTNEPNETPYQT